MDHLIEQATNVLRRKIRKTPIELSPKLSELLNLSFGFFPTENQEIHEEAQNSG